MKRIIIHHTGGSYEPNPVDKKAYHFLVQEDGFIQDGVYKPEDNENCNDGKYAQHTLKGNTGSIGVACCCNFNYSMKAPETSTKYPLTQKQFEATCKLCATLCKKYKINVNSIYTHYEFDILHNIKQGKSDITYLPFRPDLKPSQIAPYFRAKINWYLTKLNK